MHEVYTDEERLRDLTIFHLRPSPKAEKPLHSSPMLTTIRHLHRRDGEYSRSCSLRRSSHHCFTSCSSSAYFKITYPYNFMQVVENMENSSLLGSSFPDPGTERPSYRDLSRVDKKNRGWAGCDWLRYCRRWELDSPLWYSHKTRKHTWKSPIKKKVHPVKSMNKVILILFFDINILSLVIKQSMHCTTAKF